MNQQPQTTLTILGAIATAFSLGTSFVYSTAKHPTPQSYAFPNSVALSQWQLSASKPVHSNLVQPPANISGDFIAGKHYIYRQNQTLVDIEMRYLANTNGDLKSFITGRTGELSSVLRQNDQGGFYSLYTYQDKAYLDACINPNGNSTVTSDQYDRNLMIHNTHPKQILPWLLGFAEFRDKRCLWTHLSMPLNSPYTKEKTYQTIETIWFDWHSWWRSHYPDA